MHPENVHLGFEYFIQCKTSYDCNEAVTEQTVMENM